MGHSTVGKGRITSLLLHLKLVVQNVIAEMVERLGYATYAEVVEVDQTPTAWENGSFRPLMQKNFYDSLLTTRAARAVTEKILKGPATIENRSLFIGKAVSKSVDTIAVAQKIPPIPK